MNNIQMTAEAMAAEFRRKAKELIHVAEIIEQEILHLPRKLEQPKEPVNPRLKQSRVRMTKRERQLVKFLKERGPSTFKEILDNANIPAGTVSTVLRKSQMVKKNEEGKWEAM